jgi:hypothetical protein
MRVVSVLLCLAAVAAVCTPAYAALRVGWNVDIHQGKFGGPGDPAGPNNYANDFHIWGVLESWGLPIVTNDLNFQTGGPGGIPPGPGGIPAAVGPWQIVPGGLNFETFDSRITDKPAELVPPARDLPALAPPVGWPFYYFEGNWKTTGQIPYCTWMHFGLEFEEAGFNIGYWLQGVWTKDGVDPSGQPLYGFEVVHSAGGGGGGGGGRISIQNASGVETELLQMDLMVLHGDEARDFPLEDLNTDFFSNHEDKYQWISVPVPQGKMLGGSGGSDSFFDVFFDAVPGLGEMGPGDVLLARQHSFYTESTGGDPDFWQYELHGVPEPATLSLLALGGLALLRRKSGYGG